MSGDELTSDDIVNAIVLQMTHDARTTSGMVSFDTDQDSEEQLACKAGHAARAYGLGVADAALIAGIERKASLFETINYFIDEWKD